MSKTIICEICGKEAVRTGRNQKYCPGCTSERKRVKAVASVPRHGNHEELVRVAAEARRSGLTYGQMVALGGR